MAHIRSIVLVLSHSFIAFALLSSSQDPPGVLPEDDDPLPILQHVRKPRYISVHSRRHSDAEMEKGIGFTGHLMNLLKGGSIGFEFKPPGKFDDFLEKYGAKLFPFIRKGDLKRGDIEDDNEREWVDVKNEKRDEDDYGILINPRKVP